MRMHAFVAGCVLATLVSAGSARAEMPAGELRCEVHGGLGLVVATNRDVDCVYRRGNRPLEIYAGYTGIISMNIGQTADRILTFNVVSPDPGGLAVLQGDFTGPAFGFAPGDNPLVGEQAKGVTLLPVSNPSSVGQLHLNYAGVVHAGALSHSR